MLSRSEILERAVSLADTQGLDAVTMRTLSNELGVTPMSLYAHVADKDDILDAVIESRLRGIGLPDHEQPWQHWILRIADQLLVMLVEEPILLDRYFRRPVGVPAALLRMDAAFRVLGEAGFDDDDAIALFAAVHTYTIGFAALRAARSRAPGRTKANPVPREDTQPGYWPEHFRSADASTLPALTRMQPDLGGFTTQAHFSAGLAALIQGFEHHLPAGTDDQRK